MDLQNVVPVIAQGAAMVMMMMYLDADDDEDDNSWEKITVDVNEFRMMGDPSFQKHFRFTKPLFELLLQEVAQVIEEDRLPGPGRPPRVLWLKLLMALWIQANPDTFRSVALRFGVHPGDVYRDYMLIVRTLCAMNRRYVTWPNAQERIAAKERVRRRTGFPGAVLFMDGYHVYIPAPLEDAIAYRNRHHGYSTAVQAVCDDKYIVRDLYVGEAGSLHDARIFRRSALCVNLLTRHDEMLSEGEHILADTAYTLLDSVMKPFPNNGHLTARQRNFNRRLSKGRARVEHLFGRVQNSWRRLAFLNMRNMDNMTDHIGASFILHNFRIVHGQEFHVPEDEGEEEDDDNDDPVAHGSDEDEDVPPIGLDENDDDPDIPEPHLIHAMQRAHLRGDQKRWDICNDLPM